MKPNANSNRIKHDTTLGILLYFVVSRRIENGLLLKIFETLIINL